jgi:putative ABC transport system substrate-binding protein
MLIGNGANSLIEAFRSELRRLGYREGENLFLDVRDYLPEQARRHAADLVKADLDVVVAASLPQALLLRELDPNLKMVVGTAPGLVSNGFAKSLERPGGNVTGMDELPPGVTGTRLRLLKTAVPTISRVALLSTTPGIGGHEVQVADAEAVAPELRISLKVYRATTPPELFAALSAIKADAMEGFVNFQGGLSLAHRERIVAFAQEHKLPAMYQSQFFVRAGGLMCYAPDQEEQFRQAARYVDRILKGTNPGDLPILRPDRYYLTVNRTAAAAIGLNLAPPFLSRADYVVG